MTGPVEAADREIATAAAWRRGPRSSEAMREFAFQRALGAIWSFIGRVNRYVDASAPWALAKDPAQRPRLERGAVHARASRSASSASCSTPSCRTRRRKIRDAVGSAGPTLRPLSVGRLTAGRA